jgi:hypothetical protein
LQRLVAVYINPLYVRSFNSKWYPNIMIEYRSIFQCLPVSFYTWTVLWSSGQSSAYRSRGPGFDSRRYQMFWGVMGLERGPLSLMRIIEELFQGTSSSSLENRD